MLPIRPAVLAGLRKARNREQVTGNVFHRPALEPNRLMRRVSSLIVLALCIASAGCKPRSPANTATSDSAFAALQKRGASPAAMGVDQYTSAHVFEDLKDGGRIELQRQVDDSAGTAQIRSHLADVAQAFSKGDFEIPGFVHDRPDVPGTQTMTRKQASIRYEFRALPRGGEVIISSTDPEAVKAIHDFLAFQRGDHRAPGHSKH